MTLLGSHLDQITTSARAIADLEFPPPKIFTNALLGHHEITTLLRDTEPHERSLFTVDPNISANPSATIASKATAFNPDGSSRRKTVNQLQQRQGSAVAKVLGNDMLRQIQQSSRGYGRSRGVEVEVLLKAAERLCAVYPVAGAKERISRLRSRHGQIADTVQHYEGLVLKQQAKVNKINSAQNYSDHPGDGEVETETAMQYTNFTISDMYAEEEEVRELESRKKALEDRVAGIEKDLGGLLH